MPKARKCLIDLESTPFYHCINRCVRRAFLCGEDEVTGKSFEHRRTWLVDRFKFLSQQFAIDICAYAVLSNHYHLVLKVNQSQATTLSDEQVIKRWTSVYKGSNVLVERYQTGEATDIQREMAQNIINDWRERLTNISWFMRALNENIARQANREDGCTGHFWESRFKSQALLDDMAVLGCMMYVDLNPVRAGMTQSLIDSDFTSLQERIKALAKTPKNSASENPTTAPCQPKSLLPFGSRSCQDAIHFSLIDYLALADWTGRCVCPNKKGFIGDDVPGILKQLNIQEDDWLELAQHFERKFANFAGQASKLYFHANQHGQNRYRGVG